jgi:Restriction Endonuclease associating with ARP
MSLPDIATGVGHAALLRRELCGRSQEYARANSLPHCLSYGECPAVAYEPYEGGHGNFMPETYKAILSNPQWQRRLNKPHTHARTSLPRNDRGYWCELDSCNSSDALLMNVFCHRQTMADGRVVSMLDVDTAAAPEFGYRPGIPFAGNKRDQTEVDMRLGDLLVESKLTEFDFQAKSRDVVNSYRDFAEVFERRALPQTRTQYLCYQLIRNVLAAHLTGGRFCVLADERRPDLIEAWYCVMRCVKPFDLRLRCKVLTWQELAQVLPEPLRHFLAEKYGIQ